MSHEHPEPVELAELGIVDAHLLEGLLKEAGIEADVLDSELPYRGNAGFPSRVFVNSEQLEQAQRVYREFNRRQESDA